MRALQIRTARAAPFYYGWVILGLSGIVSYSSRPLMSVAVLTVFVVPMSEQFGWTRAQVAGAVSLGGVLAVVAAPLVGPVLDRYGAGMVVGISSGIAGLCAVALGAVSQIWMFYLVYVPGRATFASPLELGTSVAVSNWFIRRRPFALALNHVSQGSGLAVMPLVSQVIIGAWNWETAWYALGIWTVAVGVLPAMLLMARRPGRPGLGTRRRRQRRGQRTVGGVRAAAPERSRRNQLHAAPGDANTGLLVVDIVRLLRLHRAGGGVAAPGAALR